MTAQKKATAYWWMVLTVAVAMSSYANVRHSHVVAPGNSVAAWTAGLLPFALLVMVEGIWLATKAGVAGVRRQLATAGVSALAVVVLIASYVGVLSTVRETGLASAFPWLEFGMAAVPDLLMIFATMYVMGLRASTADDEAVTPSAWSRIGGNLVARVEAATAPDALGRPTVGPTDDSRRSVVAESPTASERAVTHHPMVDRQVVGDGSPIESPTAVDVDSPTDEVVDRPVVAPVAVAESTITTTEVVMDDSGDSPQVGAVAADEVTQPITHDDVDDHSLVDSPVVAESPTTAEWPIAHPLEADRPVVVGGRSPTGDGESSTDEVVVGDSATTPVEVVSTDAIAERVHAESGTTKPVEAVAAVLRLAAEGGSQRAIAAEVGVDRSLVRKWTQAAEDYERPALRAVVND
ncbi:helix-turn-helix domain-containing protein [Gordonia neofelifaecis]|uniref:DUF2637 domain-containing protein n=1 Tax=Gordonia neofelifaecis NRRL B-59395 TaxID=644548 RepID=F1YE75_9ACTN|nr:helix-turn-helix domain-containing protein [Gordonia neofelifaecis]EGD57165.1 hypothetical protein SCNU_02285 [Gordonia neofelifaecis NRRL B-59395]